MCRIWFPVFRCLVTCYSAVAAGEQTIPVHARRKIYTVLLLSQVSQLSYLSASNPALPTRLAPEVGSRPNTHNPRPTFAEGVSSCPTTLDGSTSQRSMCRTTRPVTASSTWRVPPARWKHSPWLGRCSLMGRCLERDPCVTMSKCHTSRTPWLDHHRPRTSRNLKSGDTKQTTVLAAARLLGEQC